MAQLSPQEPHSHPWSSLEEQLPTFTSLARLPPSVSAPSFYQPQPIRPNDENALSQMLYLSISDKPEEQNYSNGTNRKWSNEEPQMQSPVHYPSNYASYNLNKPHDITALIEHYALSDMSPPAKPHPRQRGMHQSTSQVWRQESFDDKQQSKRQAFSPLNAHPGSVKQRSAISCDEAELQWYHQNLDVQQNAYEHIYGMLLSGQASHNNMNNVKQPQSNMNFVNTPASPSTLSPPLNHRQSIDHQRRNQFDLQNKVDICTEQYRHLEKERKKTEAELAKHNLGKKISSSNNLPIPRLPPAPSRVDRLVVDFFREHARVVTLIGRMEQLMGTTFNERVHQTMRDFLDSVRLLQQRRLNERNAILSHLRGDMGSYNEEKGKNYKVIVNNS